MAPKRSNDSNDSAAKVSKCIPEKYMIELNMAEHNYLCNLNEDTRKLYFEMLCKYSKNIKNTPPRFKILNSNIPDKQKGEIFKRMSNDTSPKYEAWIQTILKIPFGNYCTINRKTQSMKRKILNKAKQNMDSSLVGHCRAKDQVLRTLAQWLSNPTSNTIALGLEGPPGIGKTTFAQNALSVLDRPICFISLGGALDSSFLLGHSYTYEGAICGRIIDAICESNCMNPIIYFDELDKVSTSSKGMEIINTLIHITDPAQNHKFRDKFVGFDIDLSRVIFIFSYNDSTKVCPILLDRLMRIQCDIPTIEDKIKISREHLMPRCVKKNNINCYPEISDEDLIYIIKNYTCNEFGVRTLERNLNTILGCVNIWSMGSDVLSINCKFEKINKTLIDKILEFTKTEKDNVAHSLMFS